MSNSTEYIPRKYGPVGACIYCGATRGKLSSEHIVPYSLGGRLELVAASCSVCAKETGNIERYITHTLWGGIRMKFDFPTRRPKLRPKSSEVFGPDGTSISIPIKDYPAIAPMLWLDRPSILDGVAARAEVRLTVKTFTTDGSDPAEVGVKHYRIPASVDTGKYFRFLAKIAHGMAVLRYGVDGFTPFLNNIIIRPNIAPMADLYAFVGGRPEVEPPSHTDVGIVHTLTRENQTNVGRQMWICEGIRLFSNWTQPTEDGKSFGSPQYIVVAGTPNSMTEERMSRMIFYPEAN